MDYALGGGCVIFDNGILRVGRFSGDFASSAACVGRGRCASMWAVGPAGFNWANLQRGSGGTCSGNGRRRYGPPCRTELPLFVRLHPWTP